MHGRITLLLIAICFAVACRAGSETAGGATVDVGRLSFILPAGWTQVPPNSGMRVAQVMIPGSGGVAELAVFHFGPGQGGDVEANLQRWIGQIESDAASGPVQRETFESGALRVTWVDAQGTLKPGQMGLGPSSPQPNARLLGAIVEGDGGPWFFKATGPDATLGPQREVFLGLLRSMKPHG